MKKLVFSTDDLPSELDDQARFDAWRDIYLGTICHFDVERLNDRPFSMRYEFLPIGGIVLSRFDGTIDRFTRTRHHLTSDPRDDLFVNINGARPWALEYRSEVHEFAPQAISLLSNVDAGRARHAGGAAWQGIVIPRSRLLDLVPNPDDQIGRSFDPDSDVTRHLKRYIETLLRSDEVPADPALSTHVETTLIDLVVLMLNGRRDAGELARARGLRAARLQAILAAVRTEFADPAFSTSTLAKRLGFTPAYIQKLLRDGGITLTERVLELRLRKARDMLADPRSDHLKVSDIALACGFNEVSYFNRCFRRRFGASPLQFRGRP